MGCAIKTVSKVNQTLPSSNLAGFYHQIQRGESLFSIAQRYGLEMQSLIKANNILENSTLEIGQQIFIPKKRDATGFSKISEGFIWPARGKIISFFGQTQNLLTRKGIVIKAEPGSDVLASRSGKVVFSSLDLGKFKNILIIDHGDGFFSIYAGIKEFLLKVNDYVKQGMKIGRLAKRPDSNAGQLYFEIRKEGIPINPTFFLPAQ